MAKSSKIYAHLGKIYWIILPRWSTILENFAYLGETQKNKIKYFMSCERFEHMPSQKLTQKTYENINMKLHKNLKIFKVIFILFMLIRKKEFV